MRDHFWLSKAQMVVIAPQSRGKPRLDSRCFVNGIVHVIRNGLRWRDAPAIEGPPKTLDNRYVRWTRIGVFTRNFADLAAQPGEPGQILTDTNLLQRKRARAGSGAPRADCTRSCMWSATAAADRLSCCCPTAR